jgi:hypothetical protein
LPRRREHPYKHRPLDIPEVGSGASEERPFQQTDLWIYQGWDQVPRRREHPYKHRPLDIPEVGSSALEERASLQTQAIGYTRGGI